MLRCHEQDLRLGGVRQGTGCVLRRGGPSGSAAGNVYAAMNSLHGSEGTGWKQGGFGGRGDGDGERRQLGLTGGQGRRVMALVMGGSDGDSGVWTAGFFSGRRS